MNEWSVYVAGTIALGALATVGGLGVAGAATSETVGLLSVSTGFASGFFGFLNNSERAGFYTYAANEIAHARAKADKLVTATPGAQSYTDAANLLADSMSEWTTWLETKRSLVAATAAQSAEVAQANKELLEFQKIVESGAIVDFSPRTPVSQNDTITLKTIGIDDLQKHQSRLRLFVSDRLEPFEVKSTDPNSLEFKMPPGNSGQSVDARLEFKGVPIHGKGTFTYK
jgi:hypothetical protein